MNNATYESELYHFGVKGMKWGVRRYQNADGSLNAAGRNRYYKQPVKDARASRRSASKQYSKSYNKYYNDAKRHPISTIRFAAGSTSNNKRIKRLSNEWDNAKKADKSYDRAKDKYKQAKKDFKQNVKNDPEVAAYRKKKAAITAGSIALAAVGGYAMHKTGADRRAVEKIIQAGRGVSKKAYHKYYDRPIDVSAKVVPNIQKSIGANYQVPAVRRAAKSGLPITKSRAEGLKRFDQTRRNAGKTYGIATKQQIRNANIRDVAAKAGIAAGGAAAVGGTAYGVNRYRKNKKNR